MKDVILTGIKPTGTPHIGNYYGAIKPAIELLTNYKKYDSMIFIADYHSFNQIKEGKTIRNHSYEVAATYLACGIDPEKTILYRQSDIQDIMELSWILSNVTSKGLLNRAHAYKASVEKNINEGEDPDHEINMGLFNYPILMAADILIMNSRYVPVGQDQKQHVEIAREIARVFNNIYGETFVLPEEKITKGVDTIIGLDGRKMSKSYNNAIELFCSEDDLYKKIKKIVTDSLEPGISKNVNCNLYKIFELFASEYEKEEMKTSLMNGIGWGEAKKKTFEVINKTLTPMREKFNYYMNNKSVIDKILENGKKKAMKIANMNMNKIKINLWK